jgi:hypothetical protein
MLCEYLALPLSISDRSAHAHSSVLLTTIRIGLTILLSGNFRIFELNETHSLHIT